MASDFDLVVRHGTIVDGSGGDVFEADVAIRDKRIVAIGEIQGRGAEEIDARGKLVTPGFVDLHTHYDGQATWAEQLAPSCFHGVTTVVGANCGVGFAPCRASDRETLVDVMEGVEDIPEIVMAEGLAWDWETFPDFLDALDRRSRDMDIAMYLPHSAVRVFVMGERGARGEPATEDDLRQMRAISREAMDAGALGFSTSRIFNQKTGGGEHLPTFRAAERELHALGAGLTDTGKGVIQLVPNLDFQPNSRDGVPVEEEFQLLERLAKTTGRPVSFSLTCRPDAPEEWRYVTGLLEQANSKPGVTMTGQVLPRPVGIVMGHDTTLNPFTLCPTYQKLLDLPLEQRIAALRTSEMRALLLKEPIVDVPGATYFTNLGRRFDLIFPLRDPLDYEPLVEASLLALARQRGVSPEEIAYDIMLEGDGLTKLYVAAGNYGPDGRLDELHDMLVHKDTVLGLGDGGAHYGLICDASYTTFLLTYWTRDRAGAKLSVPAAIKAMTRDTATTVGLRDRGLLAAGLKADLNIIDYDALTLHAPRTVYDLPGGNKRLNQSARGYDATIVSGCVTYRNGEQTRARPGQLVRGPR